MLPSPSWPASGPTKILRLHLVNGAPLHLGLHVLARRNQADLPNRQEQPQQDLPPAMVVAQA